MKTVSREKEAGKIVKKGTEVEYEGKRYDSLKQLSLELGIPYSSMAHKYYRTKNIEESVEWARRTEERNKSLVLWGQQYDSVSGIADAFGINAGCIRARMKQEVPLEDIMKELLHKETILYDGKEYAGITNLATAFGQDASLVFDRLNYGFTLERALTTPVRRLERPEFQIEYNGRVYESKRQLFREIGISGGCIYEMMSNHKVDFETAVDIYRETKERAGIPEGEMLSYLPVCIINGKA